VPDFIVGWILVRTQKRITSHQHSGSTVTALQAVLLEKSVLKRVQFAILLESFDGHQLTTVCLHGESSARLDCVSIHNNRARATMTGIATDVRSSEPQHVANEMDQEQSWLNFGCVLNAIHFYFDWNFSHR
jgi:hypothetical protein